MTPTLLVEISLKSAALILLTWLVSRLLRRSSAATRSFVWSIPLLGVIPLFVIVWLGPRWVVASIPPLAESTWHRAAQALGPQSHFAPELSPPSPTSAEPPSADPIAMKPRDMLHAIVAVWQIGVVVMALRLLLGVVLITRVLQRASRVVDPAWMQLLSDATRANGVSAEIPILRSSDIGVASTCGIFRTRILIPDDSASWSLERIRCVLLHEVAHVKRYDSAANILVRFSSALQWFNPLIWLAARRFRAEQERACDDIVLSNGADPAAYAGELLALARNPSHLGESVTLAMARPTQLHERLAAILDRGARRTRVSVNARIGFLCGFLAVAGPLATSTLGIPVAHSQAAFDQSLGIVLVLDQSGSMNGPKLELAKEAARVSMEALEEDQWFGIVTFNAKFAWAVPLQRVRDRAAIIQLIDQITAFGETDIYPALAEAGDALTKLRISHKHIILLTDGRSLPGEYQKVMQQMESQRITASTIGLGNGADLELLNEIAAWGHGRTYFLQDPAKLPELFSREITIVKNQ